MSFDEGRLGVVLLEKQRERAMVFILLLRLFLSRRVRDLGFSLWLSDFATAAESLCHLWLKICMSHQEIGIATVHYYLPSLCCPILHADPYRSVIYRQSLAIVHLSVFLKDAWTRLVRIYLSGCLRIPASGPFR